MLPYGDIFLHDIDFDDERRLIFYFSVRHFLLA